jgi:hypothetical protein
LKLEKKATAHAHPKGRNWYGGCCPQSPLPLAFVSHTLTLIHSLPPVFPTAGDRTPAPASLRLESTTPSSFHLLQATPALAANGGGQGQECASSSASLTTPASRWPGSAPTDVSPPASSPPSSSVYSCNLWW